MSAMFRPPVAEIKAIGWAEVFGFNHGRDPFWASVRAAQLALAHLESFIPPDEVVGAVAQVGRMMPLELRETAEGGLAQTPTGLAVTARMSGKD